jgi:hypothetical protein
LIDCRPIDQRLESCLQSVCCCPFPPYLEDDLLLVENNSNLSFELKCGLGVPWLPDGVLLSFIYSTLVFVVLMTFTGSRGWLPSSKWAFPRLNLIHTSTPAPCTPALAWCAGLPARDRYPLVFLCEVFDGMSTDSILQVPAGKAWGQVHQSQMDALKEW